jgi:pimeloyl-ACP methyl ester carboxylesterase
MEGIADVTIEPFSPPCSTDAVEDLRNRLRRTRWPDAVSDSGWDYGIDPDFLRGICDHWAERFDWSEQVRRFSAFPHFKATISGQEIHFLHVHGQGPAPIPLILTHGWPGSFLEFLRLIPLLTDPAAHGMPDDVCFDVVVPSLPGYGYSGQPGRGMNIFAVADLWAALMSELGYQRFAAQGGDIGAGVTTALGLRHPGRLIGLHLNFIPGNYRPVLPAEALPTDEERAALGKAAEWVERNGAYWHIQRMTPLTAAVGLNDSPAGLAAWILEKIRLWSDCDGDPLRIFAIDELLAHVTLYWMTGTIYSSFRMYFENKAASLALGKDQFISVPCAVARFPREIFMPPRSWVERGFNLRRWTDMPRGGHFAACEQPELLADDLRAFFGALRSGRGAK